MNTQLLSASKHVVIIGGGISGLSAAWYLQQEAVKHGLNIHYTVLDQSQRWGGKVWTEQVDGFVLEAGPDAFLTRKPWALELAKELGLAEQMQSVNTKNNRTFVLHKGQPVPLPEGLQLLAPTRLLPFMRSPLFSLWGKLRAVCDLFIPSRQNDTDETLANFVRRRLGAEMLDRLGEPLLAGVYNGDPEQQSIQATFPQFPALEKQHGSLIRGSRAGQPKTPKSSMPPFISFKQGTYELIKALVAQLTGDLRLNTGVDQIEQLVHNQYRIRTTTGEALHADAVIMATPAHIAAGLLRTLAPTAADHLRNIPYSGIGTAYFGFRAEDVPHVLPGFGLVIPRSEQREIDGVTWTSSKWDKRAPANCVLLRVFFGRSRTHAMLQLSEADLLTIIRAELKSMFDIAAEPIFHRIYRWENGYPQYNIGHLERVAGAEAALPPNLWITGSPYRGVGVPDCVRQGRDTAVQLVAAWEREPAQA